jgi:xanthine dehydrogenase FAD-binding subunit
MLTCDDYLSPTSLDEAFDAMAAHNGSYRLVAGATDILPWAREGRAGDVHIPVLIDIAAIPELNAREIEAGKVRLGAATRFQRFLDDPILAKAMPVMPRCAIWFADDQIRQSATIGGNLVNASPAADGTPALLALDATVVLAARRSGKITSRTLPLAGFLKGPGKTALEADEILVEVLCDALPDHGGAFEKVGHRRSLAISTACVAALIQIDATGTKIRDVRLTCAGIGPVPTRMAIIEAGLRSRPLTDDSLRIAASAAPDFVASRTRQDYRREVVSGFVLRALVNAARRAGASRKRISPEFEAAHA